jgi:hypothetical protein
MGEVEGVEGEDNVGNVGAAAGIVLAELEFL